MRRLTFLLFFLLLVPSAAFAGSVAAGDGPLVVTGASAKIVFIKGSGLVYGHINQGTLTVLEYKATGKSSAVVSGTMTKVTVGAVTQYSGSDIRFLFPDGSYSLSFAGAVIDISAVGKGTASAIGAGTLADGTMATNGGKALPLGAVPTTLVFGAGKPPNAVPTAIALPSVASSTLARGPLP